MRTLRLFGHHISTAMVYLAAIEFPVLILAFYLGVYFRFINAPELPEDAKLLLLKAITFAAIIMVSMLALRLYETLASESRRELIVRIASSVVVSTIPLSLVYFLFPSLYIGRGVIALALSCAAFLIVATRFLFFRFVHHPFLLRRILIVGTGSGAMDIHDYDRCHHRRKGFAVVGYISLPHEKRMIPDGLNVFPVASLKDVVQAQFVDELVIAVDDRRKSLPVNDILACKMRGVRVTDLATFFESQSHQILLQYLHPSWLFFNEGFEISWFRDTVKRVLDFGLAILLLPIFLPLMAIVSLAILFEDRGREPIFYSQQRVGRDGKIFSIFKFRSMRSDIEGDKVARWANQNDPRITRVGRVIRKYRIDELPQLYNVTIGDMSFIGPRPEQFDFVQELSKTIPYYNERHLVRPGITGWAQISYEYGDSEEDAKKKLQYDLYYVKNYSAFLDILVILKTAEVMLLGKGAH